MVLIGCLFRNFLVDSVGLDDYSEDAAAKLRALTLCTVLLLSGMNLSFDASAKLVIFLGIIPVFIEGLLVCLLATVLTDLPWRFALTLGFICASVGPGLLLPTMIRLKYQGYGT